MAAETPLLCEGEGDVIEGFVDSKGSSAVRSSSGGWRSAAFILGVEVLERSTFYGINSNLISYLTGPLGQSTATAAANVNVWTGVVFLLPLLGAFIADSFLGRYRTVIISSLVYIVGLGFLTLSALALNSSDCTASNTVTCSPPQVQTVFFFFSLYLMALAQGGHKPCVQALGADQFDEQDPEERKAKSSFFNWWLFGSCGGSLITILTLSYIEDNVSWALGFGIPCVAMVVSLIIFLLGTITYRFPKSSAKNPFKRISRVFILAARNRRTTYSAIYTDEERQGMLPHHNSQQFKFLNKALVAADGSKDDGKVCSIGEVEEAKAILRLFPILVTCVGYAIVISQSSTFFTKQSFTMDRAISSTFEIPSAAMQSVINITILFFIPIYDRILVPVARFVSGKPSGITMLQRIGTGILLSLLSMVIAALVEKKRLKTALEYGLVDTPNATVPMSVAWLVPQYLLNGMSQVFTMAGLQEFFYDQVPNELRSLGVALYLSIFGIGSFSSSFLISAVESATGGDGRDSWFSDNLNKAHLDYFYWLLAGMSAVAFIAYVYFSKSYIYKRRGAT